jgi:SAM-dependent methyltransferase
MRREFDAFAGYPEPKEPRRVGPNLRTIHNRITASYRDREFYDGDRANGYGGMVDDGRWGPIAERLIAEYQPETVLQVNAHKGYLVRELLKRGVDATGQETSTYAADNAVAPLTVSHFTKLPFAADSFDLVIAASAPYAGSLADAIKCLREIQRVSRKHSWVVLAAYEDENDIEGLMLLRYWFLTGTLILTKSEWREVMKHAGYTGDFRYDTAKSLKLAPQ